MSPQQRQLALAAGRLDDPGHRRLQALGTVMGRAEAGRQHPFGNPGRMLVDAAEAGEKGLPRHLPRPGFQRGRRHVAKSL
jgi:hypothetical protein